MEPDPSIGHAIVRVWGSLEAWRAWAETLPCRKADEVAWKIEQEKRAAGQPTKMW